MELCSTDAQRTTAAAPHQTANAANTGRQRQQPLTATRRPQRPAQARQPKRALPSASPGTPRPPAARPQLQRSPQPQPQPNPQLQPIRSPPRPVPGPTGHCRQQPPTLTLPRGTPRRPRPRCPLQSSLPSPALQAVLRAHRPHWLLWVRRIPCSPAKPEGAGGGHKGLPQRTLLGDLQGDNGRRAPRLALQPSATPQARGAR